MRTGLSSRLSGRLVATVLLLLGLVVVSAGAPSVTPAIGSESNPAAGLANVPASTAVDYSNPARWLSLDTTGTSPVDIFYLYPTSYTATGAEPVICAVDDSGMIAGAKDAFLRQATAFEPVGNVYAPYYRQADAADRAAMSPAEQVACVAGAPTRDGIAAFDYYVKHYNRGKPFILVGHSLGSNVMANLLSQYMGKNPAVYRRMVAAYVVGYSITPAYLAKNPFLKFAQGANDTGVIVSWNTEGTVLYGTNPVTLPGGLAINPITWTRTEATATAGQNLGSELLDAALPGGPPFLNPDGSVRSFAGIADARVDTARGVVVCTTVPEAKLLFGFPEGVYHPFDYPFYYFDVRANAANRVRHFTAPTGISRPSVSPSRPMRGRTSTFLAYMTPSAAAKPGTAKLLFYRYETKTVTKKAGHTSTRIRVGYWHLRTTQRMAAGAGGRLTLSYRLPRSGSWKVVATHAASAGYARATSFNKYFSVR